MNTKQKYAAPAVNIIYIKTDGIMQSASTQMQVYKDTETDEEDIQYSRRSSCIWDEVEEEN